MMRKIKRAVRFTDNLFGTYAFVVKGARTLRGMPAFINDLRAFKRMLGDQTDWTFGPMMPMLEERGIASGSASGHYFHQDLFVARRIHKRNPRRHIDVGSRIDGFVAHVASFREIEIVDIRPLDTPIPNVKFLQMDIMDSLAPNRTAICDSLSCLHALEHFGLGRYGDRVDPDGYKLGFANLVQMLETGGILYFSVPIGRQRIEFNAHRVFGLPHLLEMFKANRLDLLNYSYVNDSGNLIENVAVSQETLATANDLTYGCGIFELRKPRS
jgi:hypothetical protein